MKYRVKHIFFTNYMGISVLLFIGAIILFILVPGDVKVKWGALSAFEAGVLWFAFSVQKQHLEEVKLFKELFEGFNKRYDGLNEELNHIYQQPEDKPFESRERDALYKYFNLCGEEHLYADLGFIYPTVWTSWKNGMIFFRQNSRIKKLWDEDLDSDTYYGLNFKEESKPPFPKSQCCLGMTQFIMVFLCATVNVYSQETASRAKSQFDPFFWGGISMPDPKPVEQTRFKAEKGDAVAESELGEFYQFGVGVAVDAFEAVKWYRKAAEQDNAQAEYRLGFCYAHGEGVVKDAVEAAKLYRKAADQNNVDGQYALAVCYAHGEGVAKDDLKAVKLLRQVIESIPAQSQASFAHGQRSMEDEEKLKQDLGQAEYSLGVGYAKGDGVAKDEVEAVKWLRKAAELNYADAQCELGGFYYKGQGVAKDDVEAVKWYRKAAEQNFAEAQFNLGTCYDSGLGIKNDVVEAAKWYRKAADQNYADAQVNLGVCYLVGSGVVKNEAEGVKWFQKAVAQGNAQAQVNLGKCYNKGRGIPKDEAEGVKWFQKAAEQNLAEAQFNLCVCFANGKGVAKDQVEAVKWLRKSAEQGYIEAKMALARYDIEQGMAELQHDLDAFIQNHSHSGNQDQRAAKDEMVISRATSPAQEDAGQQYNTGVRYARGEGVVKDEIEAMKWYRKSAEQNLAEAQNNLGVCYANGQGVAKNEVEAIKWYRKAAEQNDAEAQFNLGTCYESGLGVKKDAVEATKWYRKAARQGLAQARWALGCCYFNGSGVPKNVAEAVKWWNAAAQQGLAEAQGELGFLYGDGFAVSKDIVKGCKWTILAAGQGNVLAKDYIQVFAYDATPEQIAEAQRLAHEFKPRKAPMAGAPVSGKGISDSNPEATGSGFFVTEDGFLVTNNHVVKDAAQIRLVTSRGFIFAQVVNVDAANDLALLKTEGQFAPLPVASSRGAHLGNSVATVGFPNIFMQGFAPKFARGEIASLAGASDDARYFQISVPLQPGNSGGPLVDEHGNVMGVVSAKLDASAALAASGELPENVNYAVKGSLLLNFLKSVPEVSAKLKAPINSERKFDEVVQSAQAAAVLVLVY